MVSALSLATLVAITTSSIVENEQSHEEIGLLHRPCKSMMMTIDRLIATNCSGKIRQIRLGKFFVLILPLVGLWTVLPSSSVILGSDIYESPARPASKVDGLLLLHNNDTTDVASKSNIRKEASCQVLISNRVGDFHYEILESVALQYPIDWTRHVGCQSADDMIALDFFLDFQYKGYGDKTEAWGWKQYFEEHLQGKVVPRHAKLRRHDSNYSKLGGVSHEDGRRIYFRAIVDATPESVVNWTRYDVTVEANCGFVGNWEARLKRTSASQTSYCVLHSKHPKKVRELDRDDQLCFLNPQHAPRCWFVPSDFPRFTRTSDYPPPPLRVCIGWKADASGEYRDTSLVAKALEHFRPNHDDLQVVVIGRNARVPQHMAKASSNISHYVRLESTHKAFYEYQQTISQCHVLIPLVHPEAASSEMYFSSGKAKLSGIIAQTIGNGIPTIVHTAVANIYRDLFTAPIFEYNTTEPADSFLRAFQEMLEYFGSSRQAASRL